jgi:hypothetical protein
VVDQNDSRIKSGKVLMNLKRMIYSLILEMFVGILTVIYIRDSRTYHVKRYLSKEIMTNKLTHSIIDTGILFVTHSHLDIMENSSCSAIDQSN